MVDRRRPAGGGGWRLVVLAVALVAAIWTDVDARTRAGNESGTRGGNRGPGRSPAEVAVTEFAKP